MAAAFDKIDNFAPDILILDMQLPDGNGFYICERLRKQVLKSLLLCSPARMA